MHLVDVASGAVLAEGRAAVVAAAQWLDGGRVLAHPTSTVYGLGGRPDPAVDAEIAGLKGRSPDQPLIRIGASLDEIRGAVAGVSWPAGARRLAERFWPGPLTLILPVTGGNGEGIAVRAESHPAIRDVLEECGGVMTSTSLNRAGEAPASTSRAALEALRAVQADPHRVAFLDAGDLPASEASTIVRVTGSDVSVIRQGAIALSDIERVLREEAENGEATGMSAGEAK